MSKNIIKELRKFALGMDSKIECPSEYLKYNNSGDLNTHGGLAWVMFFLDQFEKEKLLLTRNSEQPSR